MSPSVFPITLVLTTYRNEANVRAALRSALAQDYAPLEILIADDGSDDGTFAILDEETARYRGPHTVILERYRDHLGVEHANRWRRQVHSRFIVRARGDAVAEPGLVRRLAQAHLAERATLVSVAVEQQPGDGSSPRPAGPGWPTGRLALDNILGTEAALDIEEPELGYDPELLSRPGPLSRRHHAIGLGAILLFRAGLTGSAHHLALPLIRRLAPAAQGDAGATADPGLALEARRAAAAAVAVRQLEELFELKAAAGDRPELVEVQIRLQRRILAAARDWTDARRALMQRDLRPVWEDPAAETRP